MDGLNDLMIGFLNWTTKVCTKGHKWKLKVNRCRLQLRQCFFSQRVINSWSKLPTFVVDESFVNPFKKRLDDWTMDVDI